jgi:hypothetical protein
MSAPDIDPRVELISMLGLTSSSESRESPSRDSPPSQSEGAPPPTANPVVSSSMVVPEAMQLETVASAGSHLA